jgi:hypothetical protein
MFVRIGLVVVAIALLVLLSLGIGLGTGFVRLTPEGIAWGREQNGPDSSAGAVGAVSADDLLKQKGVAYVDPQQPAAPPPPAAPAPVPPSPTPAVSAQRPDETPKSTGIIRVTAGSNIPIKDPAGNIWEAARGFDDGEVTDRGNVKLANTRFSELFRYERWKMTAWHCQVPNGKYTVLLHFAEAYPDITRPNQRVFAVKVQDDRPRPVDVFAEAGGLRRELIRSAPAVVIDGTLTIKFISTHRLSAFINGIEVIPDGPPDGSSRPRETIGRDIGSRKGGAMRIDAGSSAAVRDPEGNTWFADSGFVGGETADRGRVHIKNTDFPEVYQTERYGMSLWRTELPNGNYTVRLHFAETSPSVSKAGQRVFDVLVKDQPLRDFDVFREAGGKFQAIVKTFHVKVSEGRLTILFHNTGKNVAEINGIEVIPER